jgi:hypothetical protein
MSISAMKQALRALERADKISGYANNQMAIYALGQAIAEAEKPAHTDHPSRHWDRTCPACVYESDISQERVDETAKHEHEFFCPRCGHCCREWVGLTDEEINRCYADTVDEFQFYQAIEAKLKEKNT